MLNEETQDQIREVLLLVYYQSEGHGDLNLHSWIAEQGLESDEIWQNYEILRERGVTENVALGGLVTLTVPGILDAEERGLAAKEQISQERQRRLDIAAALVDLKNRGEHAVWSDVAEQLGLTEEEFHRNAKVLEEQEMLRWLSMRILEVTARGLDWIASKEAS